MDQIDSEPEEAIQRIMRTLDIDRADAESIVDHSEGRLFDLDDTFNLDDPFDVDISEQASCDPDSYYRDLLEAGRLERHLNGE